MWEDHHIKVQATILATLRADIHNSSEMLQRADKRRWEAADFGAEPAKQRHPRSTMTPEQVKRRAQSLYGPRGKGRRGAKLPMPAVEEMRGKGQPLPTRKEA